MNKSELKPGVMPVRNKVMLQDPFLLSCMESVGGVLGVTAFEIGRKRPRRGKHLPIDWQIESWLEELETI